MNRFTSLVVLLLPLGTWADVVGPIDSVQNFVNVRMSADSTSEIVGRLNQGDFLPLVSRNDEWLEVAIAGGATGFISADWVVVHEAIPTVAEETGDVPTDDLPTEDPSVLPDDDATDIVEASIDQVAADVDAPIEETSAEAIANQAEKEISAAIDAVDNDDKAETLSETVAEEVEESAAQEMNLDEQVAHDRNTESDESSDMAIEPDEVAVVEADAEADVAEETNSPDDVTNTVDAFVENVVADVNDVATEAENLSDVSIAPAESMIEPHSMVGRPGPKGDPGPPGPPGAASIEGSVGFLTRFTAPTLGASSQIYDDGNNIGIGTTTPVQRLEVNGNIQIHEQNSSVAGLMITQSDGETGYIMHNRASTLTIGAGSIDRITIDSDGNVGFGVARPEHPIEVANGAHLTAGGVWTNSSSRERKENIASLSAGDALAALTSLEPVQYNYKNDQVERYVGFIAEDVPDLVATTDRDGLSSMDIVAVLTKVVQEQQKKIEELEARLDQR